MTSGLGNLRFILQLGPTNNNDERLFLNSIGRKHSVNGTLLIHAGRRKQRLNPNFVPSLHQLLNDEIDCVTPGLDGNKERFRHDIIPQLLFRVHIVLNSIDFHCNLDTLQDLQQLLNEIQIRGFVYRFVIEAYHPNLVAVPSNCSNLDSIVFATVPAVAVVNSPIVGQDQHDAGENRNDQNNHHIDSTSAAVITSSLTPLTTTDTTTNDTTIARVPNVSPPPATHCRNNNDNDVGCPVCSNDTCPVCQRNKIKYCIICMEHPVNHVIIPCGHLSLCEHCSSQSNLLLLSRPSQHQNHTNNRQPLCPDCRTPIERTMKVYGGRICQ